MVKKSKLIVIIDNPVKSSPPAVITADFPETISVINSSDSWFDYNTASQLDLCKVTEGDLEKIFGHKLPEDRYLWGFAEFIHDMEKQNS